MWSGDGLVVVELDDLSDLSSDSIPYSGKCCACWPSAFICSFCSLFFHLKQLSLTFIFFILPCLPWSYLQDLRSVPDNMCFMFWRVCFSASVLSLGACCCILSVLQFWASKTASSTYSPHSLRSKIKLHTLCVLMCLFNKIHLSRFKFDVYLNSVFCLEDHEMCTWFNVPKWGAAAAPAVLLELCTDWSDETPFPLPGNVVL